jgi:hypothetical protein
MIIVGRREQNLKPRFSSELPPLLVSSSRMHLFRVACATIDKPTL